MQDKKQRLELDMEQQTGSKMGPVILQYVKAVCCHPAYLTYMQSTSYDMLGWMTHRLESRLMGEISTTSYMRSTPVLLPGKSHEQKSLVGYSPWGRKESDTTE